MLGIVVDNDSLAVIFRRRGDDLHRFIGQGVCLGMEFDKPQVAVKREKAGGIVRHDRCQCLARHVKAHDPGGKADRLVFAIRLPDCQGLAVNPVEAAAVRQRRWHLHIRLGQNGCHPVGADGVDHFKRATLPVETEFHRIVDVLW